MHEEIGWDCPDKPAKVKNAMQAFARLALQIEREAMTDSYLESQEYSVGFRLRSVLIPKMAAYLRCTRSPVRGYQRIVVGFAYERVVLST